MFGRDDPLFADAGEIAAGDGDGDVTDTEETYTLRCEAAAERALGGLDRAVWTAGAASPAGATPRLSGGVATAEGGGYRDATTEAEAEAPVSPGGHTDARQGARPIAPVVLFVPRLVGRSRCFADDHTRRHERADGVGSPRRKRATRGSSPQLWSVVVPVCVYCI